MTLPRAERTLVMGILNTTPDSFSDGGRYFTSELAIKHAQEMIAQGVDIIDVGGESTRPGAERITVDEEQARVLPVIEAIADLGVPISIDTMNAATALSAVKAGASVINDVSGGLADGAMARTAAELEVGFIAMHWRGHSKEMNALAHYSDVVGEVISELSQRVETLLSEGISPNNLAIDPGIGFAKEPEHNWELLRKIDRINELGYPVLIGASRKRFLGAIAGQERDDATAAISALMARAGVWGVRVHDVRRSRQAIDVAEELA